MQSNNKICCACVLLIVAVMVPRIVTAQVTVLSGTLGPGDPTFHRPSTSFPPCSLSSNGTAVYYDVYTDYFAGGLAMVTMEGTVDRPVLASYPAGSFNPASACDDIIGVGGCEPLPVTFTAPIFFNAGTYDVVITTCYNGDAGDYTITVLAFLFMDGFESGDTTEWSLTVP